MMVVDKDTGYGIPNITVNFNKIPLITNDEGMISYSYKQIGNKRKQFNVSVPDSANYSGLPAKRVRMRYSSLKL
jgi:hypothetical protein